MRQKEHLVHAMYSTVNHNGLMWRVIGSWWHWEQGHLVSTVWAIGLLLGLSIREELGRWVTQTDCLQMAAVEGSTRVPVSSTQWGKGLTGGGGSRALESPSDVCVCVRSTAGIWGWGNAGGHPKGTDLFYHLCWIYYLHKLKPKVYFSFYTNTYSSVQYAYSRVHCLSITYDW